MSVFLKTTVVSIYMVSASHFAVNIAAVTLRCQQPVYPARAPMTYIFTTFGPLVPAQMYLFNINVCTDALMFGTG